MANDQAGPTYTLDEALLSVGFGKFQYFVLAYAGVGWISDAMEMMLLSFVGPAVHSQWSLSAQQESLVTSVVFIGMLVGAYTWGLVSDTFGRRKAFLFAATVMLGAGLLSAVAPNYKSLLVFRCFVGFGLGGAPVLLSWLVEFVPAPRRGTWLVIFQAFWSVGSIIESSLAWIVMPRLGWRFLLGFSALPSLVLVAFYMMTPESPRYLCSKGDKKAALLILEKMAKANGRELPSGTLITNLETELQLPHISLPVDVVESSSSNPEETKPCQKVKGPLMKALRSLSMLLSRKLVRPTLLLWALFIGNAFSYYGIVLLTTELNNRSRSCSSPTKVTLHKSDDINYKNVFAASFAEFPGLILAGLIVDRIGRKRTMGGMFLICCAFLLPLVFHRYSAGITTTILFGARACISTTFTTVCIYAPEIYPTSLRSTGVGAGSSMGRIGGMICPLVAVGLVQGCHQTAALALFTGVAFTAAFCALLLPFETKGLALADNISNDKLQNPNVVK